jgi:hypothetical protein
MSSRAPRIALLVAVAASLAASPGCASWRTRRPSPSVEARERAAEWIRVENLGASSDDALLVELAAAAALDVTRRWGALTHVVTLRVHPTHDALETAAGQKNAPWMRGWARFSDVELEAPTSWGGDRAPYHVVELLSHELTHVIMYQRVAEPGTWTAVDIPLWFREGMASVTSEQGYRRMSGQELGAWLRAHPGTDPWTPGGSGGPGQPVVYGAAHRAFERLLMRVTDKGIHQLLDHLRAGARFDDAFALSTGEPPERFLASFRQELERVEAIRVPDAVPRRRAVTLTSAPAVPSMGLDRTGDRAASAAPTVGGISSRTAPLRQTHPLR